MLKMKFPLEKSKVYVNDGYSFLSSYQNETEIPMPGHPGSFGFVRKHHQHEGIDLYVEKGDAVLSMAEGVIIGIYPFTGAHADNADWWNETFSVMVRYDGFSINYGEIVPAAGLKAGDKVLERQCLGFVETVLKVDKGRPMNMLHLEMFEVGQERIVEWPVGSEKPVGLLNPTSLILKVVKEQELLVGGQPTRITNLHL